MHLLYGLLQFDDKFPLMLYAFLLHLTFLFNFSLSSLSLSLSLSICTPLRSMSKRPIRLASF